MLADLFAVLAPVFITAGIGYAWIKAGRQLDTNQFTPIIVFIGSPCLIFSALIQSRVDLDLLWQMSLVSIIAHAVSAVMGYIALKAAGQPIRTFLPSIMLPNTGNMGLPLCFFAFGAEGLALGIAYFTISVLIQVTAGISIAAGKLSFRQALSMPHIYAIIIVILLLWGGLELPAWITNTVNLIGQFTIPLMLLFLGVSLARLSVKSMGLSISLSLLRIGGGLSVGLMLIWGFALEGVAAGVVLIQTSMPVAVFNYLFAQYYDNKPAEVAGLVIVSTTLSFATLPLLMIFIL
jgi:predicted permease